ncbi:MAG: hypothetical protein ACK5N8_09030 [Alphaproteobacteria bacterium]
MINEPLFQSNILATIYRNFHFYFFEGIYFYDEKQSLIFWILGVSIFLYANYFLVKYKQKTTYPNLFPSEKYSFDKNDKLHFFALFLLILVLIIYSFVICSLEQSLFVNYDLMNIGTTLAFKNGLAADVNHLRFLPLGFFDLNLLYAVSHNLIIFNVYTILKQLLIVCLMYKAFDFIPVTKRLLGMALIFISPSFFWLNNIVFPEQNLIVFVLLSFMALKNFSKTNNYIYLWCFVLCVNFAIYIKETTILLYFGILICSFLYNLARDNFGFNDLIHPFKTIRKFPLEYMILVSIVVFYTLFYLMTDQGTNIYTEVHKRSLLFVLNIYKYELVVCIFALLFFIKNIIKKDFHESPIIIGGTLLGGMLISFIIVFYYSLISFPVHKTYYLLLPTLFSLMYLVKEIKNVRSFALLYILLFSSSLAINYNFFIKEEGKDNAALAELISQKIENDKEISLYFIVKNPLEIWYIECMSSGLKYYFPNANITIYTKYVPRINEIKEKFFEINKQMKKDNEQLFEYLMQNEHKFNPISKINVDMVEKLIRLGVYHQYKQKDNYEIGDYVIYQYDVPDNLPGKEVLNNKKYKVYYVDDKNI